MAPTLSRRRLLRSALVAGTVAPILVRFNGEAMADTLTALDVNDSNAKALSFVTDASKIDPHTSPLYKPGQRCAGCAHFKGKATDQIAACETFPGRTVPAAGWCMVWGARAG